MTRRWSSGARPGKPAAAAPGEDSNGTIGEYCSGTDKHPNKKPPMKPEAVVTPSQMGVPFGRRSPHLRGPYSMPNHKQIPRRLASPLERSLQSSSRRSSSPRSSTDHAL